MPLVAVLTRLDHHGALPYRTPNTRFAMNVALPPPPQDPPTDEDVVRAMKYKEQAMGSAMRGDSDQFSIANAFVYEHCILAAVSNRLAAQSWFPTTLADCLATSVSGALAALPAASEGPPVPVDVQAALQAALQVVLPPLLAPIEAKIDRLSIFAIKNYNRKLMGGKPVPFQPVPFPDGKLPSAATNTPTTFSDVDKIRNLSMDELREYCTRYYPGRKYGANEAGERRRSIRDAIGCSAAVDV
ncbi:hypothetical protein C8R45DRAFT_504492 [Mycena sanguinolenta]|nr:hypothetical protein C8R45DRAFT_504492 [Mycena sanguinolenta]